MQSKKAKVRKLRQSCATQNKEKGKEREAKQSKATQNKAEAKYVLQLPPEAEQSKAKIKQILDILGIASVLMGILDSSLLALLQLCAALCFFDFAAAFPSLDHEFMFCTIEVLGAPAGFQHFFDGLYFMNVSYGDTSVGHIYLLTVFSGVLQGCPSSGSLFALSAHPSLQSCP